jgi:hypothetical protein
MIARILFAMFTLVVFTGYKAAESQRAESFHGFALVDKAGNIQKPIDYRDHYQVLGTYAVLDPKGNQMHFTNFADYKKDCLGCHIPARTTDWVYVQGYPVLAAK